MSSKKPVGQYEIDWSHPLTEGLQAFYYVTSNGYEDYVKKSKIPIVAPIDTDAVGAYHDGISNGIRLDPIDMSKAVSNGERIIFLDFQTYNDLTDIYVVDQRTISQTTTREFSILISATSIKFSMYSGGWSTSTFSTTIETQTRYKVALIHNGTTHRCYINGKLLDGSGNTGIPSYSNTYLNLSQAYSGSNGSSKIYSFMFYNRGTVDGIALTNDPYQFLKPVRTVTNYAPLFAICPLATLITDTTKGTLDLDTETGAFTYDYTDGNAPDTDYFEYQVTDEHGTSATGRVDITIDSSTIAYNDSFNVSNPVTLNGNVLDDNGNGADTYDCG